MITERSIKLISSVMLISANRIKAVIDMFWRRTNQDFNIRLVDVKSEKNNGLLLAGVSLPPSSRAPRISLAPKTPFPFPFKRLPRRLRIILLTCRECFKQLQKQLPEDYIKSLFCPKSANKIIKITTIGER